jgi:hypothetical protein
MDKIYQTMNLLNSLSSTLLLTAGLLALTSCAQLPNNANSNGSNGHPSVAAPYTDYNNLLAFANAFPKLSLEDQRKELASLNQTVARDPQTKMQLAIAYGLATSKVRDTTKAQPLLEDIISDKTLDASSLALATIMRDYLNEIGKSGQKSKDEQRRADSAQQKLDELQKKLDDLKNIEKTMVDRDQGVRK